MVLIHEFRDEPHRQNIHGKTFKTSNLRGHLQRLALGDIVVTLQQLVVRLEEGIVLLRQVFRNKPLVPSQQILWQNRLIDISFAATHNILVLMHYAKVDLTHFCSMSAQSHLRIQNWTFTISIHPITCNALYIQTGASISCIQLTLQFQGSSTW
jgi:hypothetical protein